MLGAARRHEGPIKPDLTALFRGWAVQARFDVSAVLRFGFGQPVAAERRQLQPAFDELEREAELDQARADRAGHVGLEGAVGVELLEPAELVRGEGSVHNRREQQTYRALGSHAS